MWRSILPAAEPQSGQVTFSSNYLFLEKHTMHIILCIIFSTALAGNPPKVGTCSTDSDCFVFSKKYPAPSNYVCTIEANSTGVCSLVVGAGSFCTKNEQCAQFQYLARKYSNQSIPEPVQFQMNNMCSPNCTLSSLCNDVPNPFDDKFDPSAIEGCCNGGTQWKSCDILGVDTCALGDVCSADPNSQSNALVCITKEKVSLQWIGIVLTLIGAATLNMGLNIQKLAHRQRLEKRERKKDDARVVVMERISHMKVSLANLYKNVSTVSLNSLGSLGRHKRSKTPEQFNLEMSHMPHQRSPLGGGESQAVSKSSPEPLVLSPATDASENTLDTIMEIAESSSVSSTTETPITPPKQASRRELGCIRSNLNSDIESRPQPEFQEKLHATGLAKNPVWVLGFMIFILGNIFNVIALQFAAQSLVAPLGSFSLVVNVILAPLINKEKWGYKDILGVVMIGILKLT
jgi:Magnesium transporter NIPA